MTRQETDYALLDRLASEFAEQVRAGQRPSVEEYCARHPAVAADLREVLPPLAGLVAARELLDAPPPPVVRHEKRLGDYLLLREIGRGGMGVVYEAEQVSLGRRVAIKLLPAYASSPDLATRFEREARTAGRLHHTNIVPVFGVGRDAGTLFYVMQFIPGQGLDAVITEVRRLRSDASAVPTAQPAPSEAKTTPNGRLASPPSALTEIPPPDGSTAGFNEEGQAYWRSVARVGVQVADALDYAHKQGVLHRDIKPSNLLLDPAGTVWVADFGLAKAAGQESLTADGALLGTLRYLPPEGLTGRADARSDVYSLGLTLYELAALRPAFPETDRNVLIQRIGHTVPDWVTTTARGIPRDLATVIHKAIEREPNRRYPSAAALATDLRRFLDGKPVRARWVGPVERAVRWCRQYPAQTALMGILGLLATTSVAAGLSAANDHRHLGNTEDQWAAAEVKAERAATRADAAEFSARLSRAVLFAADGRRDAATRELAAIDPGRRGWEWQYCDALADRRATRREYPTPDGGRTLALAVHPDGIVRAVRTAQSLRLELVGQRLLRELGPNEWPGGLSLDAAGERMAIYLPGGVVVIDIETGLPCPRPPDDMQPTAPIVLSADGARVGVIAGDAFGVWTVHDGKPLLRRSVAGVRFAYLALSGDGRLLAVAGTRTVRVGGRDVRDQFLGVWNVESGNERPAPAPPADAVTALAFDPTGARLAWVVGPGRVCMWDANRGRPVAAWDAEDNVDALAFTPDGRRLAGVAAGVVRLWDAATGAEVFALPAAGGEPGARLRFGDDGRSLIVGAERGPLTAWSFVPPLEKLGPPRPAGD